MILATLLACQTIEPPPNDALAYVEHRCFDIVDPNLQGECLVFDALSIGHPAAEKSCHVIDDAAWKAECFFLLSEQVHHDLKETRRLCERSDFLRNRCLSHWIRSQIQGQATLEGQDLQMKAIEIAAQIVGPEAAITMADRMLVEVMAKSVTPPFSVQACRGLESLCPDIYLEVLRLERISNGDRNRIEADCGMSDHRSAIPVSEDIKTQMVVKVAWENLCASE